MYDSPFLQFIFVHIHTWKRSKFVPPLHCQSTHLTPHLRCCCCCCCCHFQASDWPNVLLHLRGFIATSWFGTYLTLPDSAHVRFMWTGLFYFTRTKSQHQLSVYMRENYTSQSRPASWFVSFTTLCVCVRVFDSPSAPSLTMSVGHHLFQTCCQNWRRELFWWERRAEMERCSKRCR